MICTLSPTLNENQLLAFVEGEANGEISRHIEGCAACRQRAQQLKRQQQRMAARLYRIVCPSSLELGEYQLGMLASTANMRIAQHLPTCTHCRQELQQIAGFLADMTPSIELSPREQVTGHIRQLIAQLTDQLPTLQLGAMRPALAGVRGNVASHLTYTAAEIQIILDVTSDAQQPDKQQILGLLLGLTDFVALTVQLRQISPAAQPRPENILVASEEVSELGNFIFSGIAPGIYELLLTSPTLEVRIPEIQV